MTKRVLSTIIAVKEKFWEDQEWGFKHYSELVDNYRDMWIAIVDKKIVSHGRDLRKVEEEAARKTGKDKEEIAVMYVESGTQIFLPWAQK
jgi:hypothetical protein